MKKSLVTALTTALVVGAATTTFAAANPFSDVPADHWAYDAVAQLAADGVIDGYGDGSYRGQQSITRYEMAQMVARAMAKGNKSAALDKLAAEFSEELHSLGVRVAALEKKVDNVIWKGQLRYRYARKTKGENTGRHQSWKNGVAAANTNAMLFRLDPIATVNKHWVVGTRMDYTHNLKTDANITTVGSDRAFARGTYGSTVIDLGKIVFSTGHDYAFTGSSLRMTGARVQFGKDIKVAAYAGRYNFNNYTEWGGAANSVGNLIGVEVYNDRKQKLTYGVGYQHFTVPNGIAIGTTDGTAYDDDKASVISFGLGYKLTKSVALEASYAKNTKGDTDSSDRQAMLFKVAYKGADRNKPGSYGLWVNYQNTGRHSILYGKEMADIQNFENDFRGLEFGGQVALDKNILWQVRYLTGRQTSTGEDSRILFSEMNFFF